MEKIIAFLNDPNWWISVFAVGIIINLFSAYLKSALDRAVAKYSEIKAKQLANDKQSKEDIIDILVNGPMKRLEWKSDYIRLTQIQIIVFISLSFTYIMLNQNLVTFFSPESTTSIKSIIMVLFIGFFMFVSSRTWVYEKIMLITDDQIRKKKNEIS